MTCCPVTGRELHGPYFFQVGDLVKIVSSYLYSTKYPDWNYSLGLVIGHDRSFMWDSADEELVGVKVLHLTEFDRTAAQELMTSYVSESLILLSR